MRDFFSVLALSQWNLLMGAFALLNVCMCVCVHEYVFVCVHTYVCACICVCMCNAYVFVCVHAYVFVCMCMHVCVCMCVWGGQRSLSVFLHLCLLVFGDKSPSENMKLTAPAGLASRQAPGSTLIFAYPPLGSQVCSTTPSYFSGFWDSTLRLSCLCRKPFTH